MQTDTNSTDSNKAIWKSLRFSLDNAVSPTAPAVVIFIRKITSECADSCTSNRSFFVECLPSHLNEESVSSIFLEFGPVESVTFVKRRPKIFHSSSQRTFLSCYIVFSKKIGLDNVFGKTNGFAVGLSSKFSSSRVGVKNWCEDYQKRVVKPAVLLSEAERFLVDFDKISMESLAKVKNEEAAGDGWTTVSRSSKRRPIPRRSDVEDNIKEKINENQHKINIQHFYRFQVGQTKIKNLENLRKKFDEDKNNLSRIKLSRKFKPY